MHAKIELSWNPEERRLVEDAFCLRQYYLERCGRGDKGVEIAQRMITRVTEGGNVNLLALVEGVRILEQTERMITQELNELAHMVEAPPSDNPHALIPNPAQAFKTILDARTEQGVKITTGKLFLQDVLTRLREMNPILRRMFPGEVVEES